MINPRWATCAAELGREPKTWEFMAWITERWSSWCLLTGRPAHQHTDADHAAFDAWLSARTAIRMLDIQASR